MSERPYYQDDLVTLYHGDCREQTEWLEADVLVTDPPYGIGWAYHGGGNIRDQRGKATIDRRTKKRPGIANDADTSTRDAALAAWGSRPFLIFGAWSAPFVPHKQVLVWRKGAASGIIGNTTGFRRDTELIFLGGDWPPTSPQWSSVMVTEMGVRGYAKDHPHTKPVELMGTLIDRCPTGVIADPFAGSGTTLVAAKMLGRRAIGVELDERYCEVAAKRLAQETLFAGALIIPAHYADLPLRLNDNPLLSFPEEDGAA